jgi:hypothetical protein
MLKKLDRLSFSLCDCYQELLALILVSVRQAALFRYSAALKALCACNRRSASNSFKSKYFYFKSGPASFSQQLLPPTNSVVDQHLFDVGCRLYLLQNRKMEAV